MKTTALILFCFCLSAQAQLAMLAQQSSASAPASDLTGGIAAYWTLDNSASWVDSSGNNRTLTQNGTITNAVGIISNCAGKSSGTGSYFSRADDDCWSALASSLTICGWVNLSGTNAVRNICSKEESTSVREYELYYSNTRNSWAFNVITNAKTGTVVQVPTNNVALDTWYFISAVIDTTNRVHKLRVGTGTELGAWSQSATWNGWGYAGAGTNTTGELWIGKSAASEVLVGLMDEIGIWNRTLSDLEITNLFNSGSGKTWPF